MFSAYSHKNHHRPKVNLRRVKGSVGFTAWNIAFHCPEGITSKPPPAERLMVASTKSDIGKLNLEGARKTTVKNQQTCKIEFTRLEIFPKVALIFQYQSLADQTLTLKQFYVICVWTNFHLQHQCISFSFTRTVFTIINILQIYNSYISYNQNL